MWMPLVASIVTMVLTGPTEIPTPQDHCPVGATLTEYTSTTRLYVCAEENGAVLWLKDWCGEIPTGPTRLSTEDCFPGPGEALTPQSAFAHFTCDVATYTWRVQCRRIGGEVLWDVPLEKEPTP